MSSVSFVVKPNSNTSNIAHFVPAELTKKRVNSPVQKAVPRMRYDFEDNPKSDIVYREIESSDFEVIKTLHEELFPVKYSDAFYQNTCNGIGVGGGRLYSSLAVLSGRVIGFILAQMVLYPSKSEDRDLFSIDKQPKYVCYILTLGLTKTCRRSGLGTKLIQRCEEYASLNWDCGAVYLHVIHNNTNAIRFYQKNGYSELRHIDEFYYINERYESAYLYIRYMNGFKAPLPYRLWSNASYFLSVSIAAVSNFFALLSPTGPNRQSVGPYQPGGSSDQQTVAFSVSDADSVVPQGDGGSIV